MMNVEFRMQNYGIRYADQFKICPEGIPQFNIQHSKFSIIN